MTGTANSDGGSIALGVLLLTIGLLLILDVYNIASTLRRMQNHFFRSPWVWPYRLIGAFGIVGGLIVIIRAVS